MALLVGKSNDLENGIAYLLNLFSEKTPIYVVLCQEKVPVK